MEDTPLVVENDTNDRESRRRKDDAEKQETLKSEALGILAVEPKPERLPAETQDAAGSQPAPEHIGHVLVNSEAKPEKRHQKPVLETSTASMAAEKRMKIESSKGPAAGKRIDTLSRAELMTLGETITIDGNSLRQIYETHLIGERGLRRLASEYMHGGDLRRALRQEVLQRERDFERDPAMRDLAPSIPASAESNPTLEKLLQKAAVSVADSGEEAAFFKARARYEATHQRQNNKQQRRLIDITLSLVIAILVVLVIFMYLARR
jgi:hypothetical protein